MTKFRQKKFAGQNISPIQIAWRRAFSFRKIRAFPILNLKRKPALQRTGSALIIVLIIVMIVTTLSIGFVALTDSDLACGVNVSKLSQVQNLAQSGLEHAAGLILRPQEISGEYWTGANDQQVVQGSNGYYHVTVTKDSPCNYTIRSTGRLQSGSETISKYSLTAQFRIDPAVAFKTGDQWTSEQETTIYGDVHCGNNLYRYGNGAQIFGDAYARYSNTALNVSGSRVANTIYSSLNIGLSGIQTSWFTPSYFDGTSYKTPVTVATRVHPVGNFDPTESNPAGVRYRASDANLPGNATINGTLVIKGDLIIDNAANIINAQKNWPALIVYGDLIFKSGGTLQVNGYTQIGGGIIFSSGAANARLDALGAVYCINGNIDGLEGTSNRIVIIGDPDKAAIRVWSPAGQQVLWSPAGGGFFKNVGRL